MSTIRYPHEILRRKPKGLALFFASAIALALFIASPSAGMQIQPAKAQTTGEATATDQEPAAVDSSSATQAQNETRVNDTSFVGNDNNIDEQNNYLSANLSTLSISSTVTTEVRPDQLSVSLGVETNGTTAQEAVLQNSNLTTQVISAVRGLGIDQNRIETSSYSVLPIYQPPMQPCIEIYPPPPGCETRQEIIGYRATNTITVTLDVPFLRMVAPPSTPDVGAGQVIDAAVKAGANRIDGILFFISPDRQEEIRDTLIGDAIANARQRANIASKALGMSVVGVESATINPVDFPVFSLDLRESSAAGTASVPAPTQILPGEQEISTTVDVVFYMNGQGSAER